MHPDDGNDYDCTWTREGVAAVVTSRGKMRGTAAFDRYLCVVNEAISSPEIIAIVSDLRGVTRLPTVGDALRFARVAAKNPAGQRIRRSAVVAADGHPIVSLLLRILASGSPFFPDRRVFAGDRAAAITWANAVRHPGVQANERHSDRSAE